MIAERYTGRGEVQMHPPTGDAGTRGRDLDAVRSGVRVQIARAIHIDDQQTGRAAGDADVEGPLGEAARNLVRVSRGCVLGQ